VNEQCTRYGCLHISLTANNKLLYLCTGGDATGRGTWVQQVEVWVRSSGSCVSLLYCCKW